MIIPKTTFLETMLKDRLEIAAHEIVDALLPKYQAEAEALLEKAANRIIKSAVANLVIEDKGSSIAVTLPPNENK